MIWTVRIQLLSWLLFDWNNLIKFWNKMIWLQIDGISVICAWLTLFLLNDIWEPYLLNLETPVPLLKLVFVDDSSFADFWKYYWLFLVATNLLVWLSLIFNNFHFLRVNALIVNVLYLGQWKTAFEVENAWRSIWEATFVMILAHCNISRVSLA